MSASVKNALYLTFLFTYCFASNISFAQQFSIINYTVNDGLPSNQITSSYEDSYGFLWIGTTNGGISRFNGKNFVNYGFMEGLQDLYVNAIYEDSHHRLWVGTLSGIAELRGNRFIAHHTKNKEEFTVWAFKEVNGRELWVTTSKGIYRFADSVWIPVHFNTGYNVSPNISSVQFISTADGIYVNYGDKLVLKKKDSLITLGQNLLNSRNGYFHNLLQINNRIFINTKNCLYEIVHQRLKVLIDSIGARLYFTYYLDKEDNFWLLIENKGLYCYHSLPGDKKQLSFIYNISNAIGFPFADKNHNLWLASYDGLLRIQPKTFSEVYWSQKNFYQKRPYMVSVGNDQLLIFGAQGPQLYKNGHITHLRLPVCYNNLNNYSQDVVEGEDKDRKNNVWFITRFRKLFKWNGIYLEDFSSLLRMQHTDYIYNLAVDPVTNRIFLCGDSTLLAGNEKRFDIYRDKNGMTFPKSTSILFTRSGVGIVNVFLKGIYFITKQNEIIKAPAELNMIEKGNYTYFYEDRQGNIWVSNAGKGLIRFTVTDDYKVKDILQFNTGNGLPDNKIVSMAFDTKQNIWANTNRGVTVLQNVNENFSALGVHTIGREQGMLDEASLVGQIIADDTGNVWISGIDRLIKFNNHQLRFTKTMPRIVIEKVMLNMKETDWTPYSDSVYSFFQLPYNLRLPYSQNSIGIQFIGTCLTDASHLEYSYRLEPLDTAWSNPSSNNFVSILKLSPGKYSFQVKARASNSLWCKPVLYNFIILQPFWETWWFRLTVAIAILTAFYSFMRYRWQQKINLLEMRNRISQDLHDEIGGSISGINLLSQMASEKLQHNDLDEASAYLFKVKNYTQDVIEKLGDMVWIFNPQNDSIEKILQRLNSFAVSIATSKNIKIFFETDKESETTNLTIGERKVIYLVSKEALNNIFKYAACRNVYYSLRAKASKWQLVIKDDGKGFMPAENEIGNGLKNMKARADEIGATFSIQSQVGTGTTIIVTF